MSLVERSYVVRSDLINMTYLVNKTIEVRGRVKIRIS